jgi:hypothetical protein
MVHLILWYGIIRAHQENTYERTERKYKYDTIKKGKSQHIAERAKVIEQNNYFLTIYYEILLNLVDLFRINLA